MKFKVAVGATRSVRHASSAGAKGLGYAGNLAVLAVCSVATIPALIASVGGAKWGAIALGQAIGLVFAATLAFGWGFKGPAAIARMKGDRPAVHREIRDSIRVRAIVWFVLLPVMASASYVARPAAFGLVLAGTLSTAVLGFRMNWVYVGLGSPALLMLLETLPRVGGLMASVAILVWTDANVAAALGAQGAGQLLAVALAIWWSRVPVVSRRERPTSWALLRAHSAGVPALTVSAAWSSAPMMAVAAFAPASLPAFALVTRLQAQANSAMSPFIDVVQGWVPVKTFNETHRRAKVAVSAAGLGAAFGFIAYVATAPAILKLLGAGLIEPGGALTMWSGACISLSLIAQSLIRGPLAAMGLTSQFSTVVYVAVSVGLICLIVGTRKFGAEGALAALATSMLIQIVFSLAFWRAHRNRSSDRERKP